jgi:hypothetical protein
MASLYSLLLIFTLIAFIWGLIAPSHFARLVGAKKSVTRMHTGFIFGSVSVLLFTLAGMTAPAVPLTQAPVKSTLLQTEIAPASVKPQTKASEITTKEVTETRPIAFTSSTQADGSLAKGQSKVIQAGVSGTETLVYKVTYTNGKQTGKVIASTSITVPPINEIVANGTYVAPAPAPVPHPSCINGSYVNLAGSTVCSPETSPSAPAGASAKCRDGTYSFSQSRSGTCSHHGGVSIWL